MSWWTKKVKEPVKKTVSHTKKVLKSNFTLNEIKNKVSTAWTNTRELAHDTTVDLLHGGGHILEAGYDLATGDVKKAGKDFAKGTKELSTGLVESAAIMNPGVLAYNAVDTKHSVSKVADVAGNTAAAAVSYVTGNANQGTDYLEAATGADLDASKEKAKEKEAKAKYQAEVDKANAAEARNRRANLLALRKALVPSLSRSSQGGGGAGYFDEKSQGGITLG